MMSVSDTVNSDTLPAPTSLEEMQNMSYDEFRQVERYQWGEEGIAVRRVIRHIIELADKELSWQGKKNSNTQRDFWYNPVKPILQRAFEQKLEDPNFDFNDRMNHDYLDVLSNKVKEGEYTYTQLNIQDESRSRNLELDGIEHDKILFAEKESAYNKLRPLSNVYNISIISGSGWSSTAALEDLANELDSDTSYSVFLLTDYDPDGFDIGEEFIEKAELFDINIDFIERIGINPEQIDEKTLKKQRFKPPKDGNKNWMEEHGIDGRYGLEIEAIGELNNKSEALRETVIPELKPYLRDTERVERDVKRQNEFLPDEASNRVVNDIIDDLHRELYDEALEIINRKNISVKPYTTDQLHNAAIRDTNPPSPDNTKAVKEVKNGLEEKILSGQISVEELLTNLN